MTNKTALFAQLNTLRVAAGKAPLASWKQSNAALEAAVAALTPAAPVEVKAKKTRADRGLPKGLFKSKVPAMKNERGKSWSVFTVLTNFGELEGSKEAKGTYFYFTLNGDVMSGKMENFADLMKNDVLDLRVGA